MPVKSSFSHVIEPNKFVSPIDLGVYQQGVQYSDQLAKQNLTDISALHNSIFNIPTYGKDKEKLMELDANLKQQLQGMNLSNLGSMKTSSQIKNLISSAANNPDVAGIAQRYGSYSQELKKQQDAEAKGQTYVSPLLRQANNYYNSGTYKTDTRFNGSGFVAPDDKELDEIAKNTPEWENIVTKDGYDITQKGKAEGALFNNYYNHFNTNPKWIALLNDQFQQNLEGVDIQTIHNQGIEGIKQLFPHLPPEAQQQALNDVEEGYQLQQTNPYIGNAWKDKLKDDYFKNQAYMAAQAKTYVNTVGMKVNEYQKEAVQHQYRQTEHQQAKYFDQMVENGKIYVLPNGQFTTDETATGATQVPGKTAKALQGMNPVVKKYYDELIKRGVNVLDPATGKPIPPEDLPDLPEKKAAVAQSNKDLGTRTVKNLISVLKQGVITPTHQAELESIIKNRKKELGLTDDATIEEIKFENGKVKFLNTKGINKSYEFTPEEFEKKLSGTATPVVTGTVR